MSDQVIVGGDYLAEAANDMTKARELMQSHRDQMEQDLTRILGESWQGASNTAYNEALQAWNASLEEMRKIVDRLGAAVTTIGGNYHHTERSVEGNW